MSSQLIEHSEVRKELRIDIPAEVVQPIFDRISQEYARKVSVPGFRPGRTPVALVRRRFKDEIAAATIQEVFPEAYEAALREHNLRPLGEPDFRLENADGLKDLGVATVTVSVTVEVFPTITLKKYKGLEVVRRVRPVTGAEVDKIIDKWRTEEASLFPVEDRPAQVGDTVNVSLQAHFVNSDDDDFDLEEADIELGAEATTLAEFTECLTGARPDEERSCVVHYPLDFPTENLAGKQVRYDLKANEIYRKELPVLDDAWAQSLDKDYESVADMRSKIQAEEAAKAREESAILLQSDMLGQLIALNDFDVPTRFLMEQGERLVNQTANDMARQGMDPQRFSEKFWNGVFLSMLPQANDSVRSGLLVTRITEVENIEATESEVEAEIAALAEKSGVPVERVAAELLKGDGEEALKAQVRSNKAIEFLMAHAHITDGPWVEPELDERPDLFSQLLRQEVDEQLAAAASKGVVQRAAPTGQYRDH